MQQQEEVTPVPNLCACILHESTAELRRLLAKLEAQAQPNAKDLKRALRAVEDSVKLHVTEFMPLYARNMVELSKMNVINITPVQTSVWKDGDEKKIREPPKKKLKKVILAAPVGGATIVLEGATAAAEGEVTKPAAKKPRKKATTKKDKDKK
jgi:hypothetical protein